MSADRWLQGRVALVIAFVWGIAEATLFFIVPDVFLTVVGCRAVKPAMKAALAALLGALLGGVITYSFLMPDTILQVPGIDWNLAVSVQDEFEQHGLAALLIGPTRGIPYKIYAVEWAARGGALLPFLLVSIPARLIRFALSALVARVVANTLTRWTRQRIAVELAILGIFWVAFYAFYFAHFGGKGPRATAGTTVLNHELQNR